MPGDYFFNGSHEYVVAKHLQNQQALLKQRTGQTIDASLDDRSPTASPLNLLGNDNTPQHYMQPRLDSQQNQVEENLLGKQVIIRDEEGSLLNNSATKVNADKRTSSDFTKLSGGNGKNVSIQITERGIDDLDD